MSAIDDKQNPPHKQSPDHPPQSLKVLFKHYRLLPVADLECDPQILHPGSFASIAESTGQIVRSETSIDPLAIRQACEALGVASAAATQHVRDGPVHSYSIATLPGLTVIPNLLPPVVQPRLLDTLLHDCLSDPANKTNVHAHHQVPYPSLSTASTPLSPSFFHHAPDAPSPVFEPLDRDLHSPFTPRQFLSSKLHWLTLGAQYDWTAKRYLAASPPFPSALTNFLRPLFPALKAEAAIVNLYSAGDTLGVHRDVAETSEQALVSLSVGCDAIFLAGLDGLGDVVLRLRSSDCVVLNGEARWAWHGVPKILAGTCLEEVGQWPAVEGKFEDWRGWMDSRRVNLSVRQVKPSEP